jgi:hypothetical protein
MDNVVYLDHKAKEFENLKEGVKTMIIRGAMGRKLPYGKVIPSDVLYFMENNGEGLVKARAVVKKVFNSDKLSKEESVQFVEKNQDKLLLDKRMMKRFAGKRYIVLITIADFELTEPFGIDKSAYGNMDNWLPVEDINKVRMKL